MTAALVTKRIDQIQFRPYPWNCRLWWRAVRRCPTAMFADANNPDTQAASADAAKRSDDGDVILISAGFRPETVKLAKNVSLIGEGVDPRPR